MIRPDFIIVRKYFAKILAISICTLVVCRHASAQNRYLLLEYIKLKPGITDSSSIIANTRQRLQQQNERDHSVLQSSLWESLSTKNKGYDYIVATVFKNFNDYMSQYKNRDSTNVYYSLSKGRLDSASTNTNDSFAIVYTPIFEVLAQTPVKGKQPELLLMKNIKATSGKEIVYENLEMSDWLPIHQDLMKKGYEYGYNLNRLIFPLRGSPYNYTTCLFYADEAMFDKQDDIDYEPYMRANQAAFINSGRLRTEADSDLLKFVTDLNSEEKK